MTDPRVKAATAALWGTTERDARKLAVLALTAADAAASRQCNCPTCRIARAMHELDTAQDSWLDDAEERAMLFSYLRDEVLTCVRSRRVLFIRRRLRAALALSQPVRP